MSKTYNSNISTNYNSDYNDNDIVIPLRTRKSFLRKKPEALKSGSYRIGCKCFSCHDPFYKAKAKRKANKKKIKIIGYKYCPKHFKKSYRRKDCECIEKKCDNVITTEAQYEVSVVKEDAT